MTWNWMLTLKTVFKIMMKCSYVKWKANDDTIL
jgi:hypothetical protein